MQDLDWDDIDTTVPVAAGRQQVKEKDAAEAEAHAQAYLNRLQTYSHSKTSHTIFSVADFDPNSASFAPQMRNILEKSSKKRCEKEGAFLLEFARRCQLFQQHEIEDAILTSLLLEHACEQTFTHSHRLYSCGDENCGYYYIILSGVVSILASTASTSDSSSQAIAAYLDLVADYPSISSEFTKGDEYVVGSLGPSGHCGEGKLGEHHKLAAIVTSPIAHFMAIPVEHLILAQEISRKRKMQRVIEMLNVVECTAPLSTLSKRQIAFSSSIVCCKNSSTIVLKQGAFASQIGIICSGMFRVVRRVLPPRNSLESNLLVDIGRLGEGEIFVGGIDVLLNHYQQEDRRVSRPTSAAGSSKLESLCGRYESTLMSLGDEYMRCEIILVEIHQFVSKVHELEASRRLFYNFLKSGINNALLKSGVESALRARKQKAHYIAESEKYSSRKSPHKK